MVVYVYDGEDGFYVMEGVTDMWEAFVQQCNIMDVLKRYSTFEEAMEEVHPLVREDVLYDYVDCNDGAYMARVCGFKDDWVYWDDKDRYDDNGDEKWNYDERMDAGSVFEDVMDRVEEDLKRRLGICWCYEYVESVCVVCGHGFQYDFDCGKTEKAFFHADDRYEVNNVTDGAVLVCPDCKKAGRYGEICCRLNNLKDGKRSMGCWDEEELMVINLERLFKAMVKAVVGYGV